MRPVPERATACCVQAASVATTCVAIVDPITPYENQDVPKLELRVDAKSETGIGAAPSSWTLRSSISRSPATFGTKVSTLARVRVQRVVDFYAKGAQFGANLSAEIASNPASHSTLNAVMTGLNEGMATNAAVDSSPQAMHTNVAAIVAPSDARAAQRRDVQRSAAAPAVTISGRAGQSAGKSTTSAARADHGVWEAKPPATDASADQKKQQREADLAACMWIDNGCTYGTGSKCVPGVAYSDEPWAGRQQLRTELLTFDRCTDNWSKVCWPSLRARLPDMKALGKLVDKLGARYANEPMEVTHACPHPGNALNSELVSQVPFWCSNLQRLSSEHEAGGRHARRGRQARRVPLVRRLPVQPEQDQERSRRGLSREVPVGVVLDLENRQEGGASCSHRFKREAREQLRAMRTFDAHERRTSAA